MSLKSRRHFPLATLVAAFGLVAAGSSAVAAGLPDGRRYELVSPPGKNGADVMGLPSRTRAAASGDMVQFASLGGFGDIRGSGVGRDYLAVRTGQHGTNGWTTHGITPGGLESGSPLDILVVANGLESRYVDDFSSDLTKGVFLSNTPLTNDTDTTSAVPNLYVRHDLQKPGAGDYTLLSDCPACAVPLPFNPAAQPLIAGASSDFRHVIFESTEPLTNEVGSCMPGLFGPACPRHLFEWADGETRLAGVLPDGSAAGESLAGQGARDQYVPHAVSQDGSRIFFTVPTIPGAGDVYMRVNNGAQDAITVKLNVSEPAFPDVESQPAKYQDATPDGSKVFFTASDTLFIYDTNAPDGNHLRLVSENQGAGGGGPVLGVIGTSNDGHYVYFVAGGQLAAGEPTTDGDRIFLWHDGIIHEVGKVQTSDVEPLVGTAGWRSTPKVARVTPDGQHLLFRAVGTDELPHDGADNAPEMFLYDADANGGAGRVVCASCHQPDSPSLYGASFFDRIGISIASGSSHLHRSLSDDGRYVFFHTREQLVPDDDNGTTQDVYEYDSVTGAIHLLSSGRPGSSDAYFMEASASGGDAFFITRDQLTGWDLDGNVDLYDARVGGGVPDPSPSKPGCTADDCRAPQRVAASIVPRGSSTFRGHGNKRKLKQHHCQHGKHRRRVNGLARCIKRRHRASRHVATAKNMQKVGDSR